MMHVCKFYISTYIYTYLHIYLHIYKKYGCDILLVTNKIQRTVEESFLSAYHEALRLVAGKETKIDRS